MGFQLQFAACILTASISASALTTHAAERRVEIVGHKGSSAAPENTLASCIAGFKEGADAVEIDVRTTADGVLVNFHDGILDNRTDGTGKVADHTLAELKQLDAGSWYGPQFAGERIPTLEEMLLEAKSWHKRAYLDVKLASVESIAQVVAATGFPQRDLVILAWSISGQLYEHLATFPQATVIHAPCCPNVLPATWSPDYFHDLAAIGVDGIAFNHTVLTRNFLNDAKAAGMPVITYTVNDLAKAQGWADAGVQAIITDHPGTTLHHIDWDASLRTRSVRRQPDGQLTIQWRALVGDSYRVEHSPSLAAGEWTPLTTVVAGGILPSFSLTPTGKQGFLRVVHE